MSDTHLRSVTLYNHPKPILCNVILGKIYVLCQTSDIAEANASPFFSAGTTMPVFYHANWVNPDWADQMDLSKVIGNHLFYTWDGVWDD